MTPKLSGPMLQPTSGTLKQLVVLLHGYGSDGRDLIALGQYWREDFPDALFVAPNAHEACDIAPTGYQWFALDPERIGSLAPRAGAETARPIVGQFLQDLWAQTGLGPADTVLAGFSQGAMMALDVGLRLTTSLKGIIAFSGMVVTPETLADEIGSKPPVQLIHGDRDEVVPVAASEAAQPLLAGLGIDSRLYIARGAGHTIAQDGLDTATRFLGEIT